MNAFILILPIFLLRYVYVAFKAKHKLQLLNYFPIAIGSEKYGKYTYFLVNTFLLFAPLFMRISNVKGTIIAGSVLYTIGLSMYAISIRDFISENGLIRHGLYTFCRNPQAISFLLIYFGIAVLTNSLLYFSLSASLIWAFNELAKSEERFCRLKYGKPYDTYEKFSKRFL